jgi:thiol-disulfide isomerase/thioredoxin
MVNQILRKFKLVLVFLFASAMFWSTGAAEDTESAAKIKELHQESQVVVYYFHGERRCPTCRKIEELSRKAVTEGFAEEIANGAVRFEAVNVDQAENSHFIQEYQLYTRALILSEQAAGGKELKRKNLDRIWELIHRPPEFSSYVQRELEDFLSGNCCP